MALPPLHRASLLALSLVAVACGKSAATPPDGGSPGPLTAPTGLVATPSSTSLSVQLTWNAEAAATSGYQIWRSTGAAPQAIDTSNTNGYIDDMPPPGATITYTVRAVDASGSSADSNAATALTIPAAPTNLAATAIGATSIAIQWTEAAGATGGDEVSYLTGHAQATTSAAAGQSFTADNLIPATTYLFSVIARDATGQGPSATASFTTLAADDAGPQPDGGTDAGPASDAGGDAGPQPDAGEQSDAGSDAGPGPGGAFNLSAYGSDSWIVLQWDDQSGAGAASYQVLRAAGSSSSYAQIGTSAVANFADTGGSGQAITVNQTYSYYVVPIDGSGNPLPSSSAASAAASGVSVFEADRYIDDAHTSAVPADFSGGLQSLALHLSWQLIPAYPDGGFDTDLNDAVPGYGSSDGHAAFPGVPDAGYLLYATSPDIFSFMPASARSLDLSSAFAGGATQAQGDEALDLHLTGLVPWDSSGDSLQAFSWGAADSSYNGQSLDQSLPTPLADGGTTAIEDGVDSNGLFSDTNLLASSRGDILYILQTATDSSGVGPYQAVRAGLALDGLNFTDGATAQVAGALASTPSTSQALAASLSSTNGASGFLTYAGAVNPSAQFGDAAASHPSGAAVLAAEPGFAANGSYGFSNTPPQLWFGSYAGITPFAPELVVGNFPNTGSNVSFGSNGTVSFFNPFPSGWTLFLVVEVPFTVQLNVSGMGAVPVAGRLHSQGGLSSYIGAIGARLSPVTSPKINGAAANHAGNTQLSNFNASQPLLFSWSAPALGSPTRYTVTVWALDANGVSGTPAAVLQTKSLQAQLPAGWLQSGTPYVAYITAVSSDADRLGLGVLAYDGNADFADCISSAFQVQ